MNVLDQRKLEQKINAVADEDFSRQKVFGAAYWVQQAGYPALCKCYGTRGISDGVPVTDRTVFRLASMSKPITAVATLLLADRGALALGDPIAKYLPEFEGIHIIDEQGVDHGKPQTPPTLRQILTHTSGIGSNPEKLQNYTVDFQQTLEDTVAYFAKAGLDFAPDSMELYSGMAAFDVLTKVIETVSGRDYQTFLREELFLPCDMPDTTFLPDEEQRSRRIDMHTQTDGKNDVFPMPEGCVFEDFPATHFLGGAGLVSTLHDYANFAQLLLGRGSFRGKRLLSEETFALLPTPYVSQAAGDHWGLGVRVVTKEGASALPVGAFGWSGAYGTHFWIDPENGICAVYLKNSKVDGGAYNQSAKAFEQAVMDALQK